MSDYLLAIAAYLVAFGIFALYSYGVIIKPHKDCYGRKKTIQKDCHYRKELTPEEKEKLNAMLKDFSEKLNEWDAVNKQLFDNLDKMLNMINKAIGYDRRLSRNYKED